MNPYNYRYIPLHSRRVEGRKKRAPILYKTKVAQEMLYSSTGIAQKGEVSKECGVGDVWLSSRLCYRKIFSPRAEKKFFERQVYS